MIENRICGYSCEHNKGGVCQTTACYKGPTFSTTTSGYYQVMDSYYTQDFVNILFEQIEDLTCLLEKAKLVIPTYYVELLSEIDQTLKKHEN